MKRHPDPARYRLAFAHRRNEGPLPGGNGRRLVEIRAPRLENVHFGDVPVRVHRYSENDVGVLARGERRWRIDGIDVLNHHGRRDRGLGGLIGASARTDKRERRGGGDADERHARWVVHDVALVTHVVISSSLDEA